MARYFFVMFVVSCGVLSIQAETKIFVRDYSYSAGEADSKITARSISLDQVKRILLEEIGVFLQSSLEIEKREDDTSYSEITKEEIKSISAGITETKVLDERWTGDKYYIKAQITVDPDDMKEKLNRVLQDKDQAKNLEEAQLRADSANNEIVRLKKELALAKTQSEKESIKKQYSEQTQTLDEVDVSRSAHNSLHSRNFRDAIRLFSEIANRQKNNFHSLYNLGVAYAGNGEFQKAVEVWNKSIDVNPRYSPAYVAIGHQFFEENKIEDAMMMFRKALDVNPNAYGAYLGIGEIHYKNHRPLRAVESFEKAIQLNKRCALAYVALAKLSFENGNRMKARKLMRHAARLGNASAKKYLLENKE